MGINPRPVLVSAPSGSPQLTPSAPQPHGEARRLRRQPSHDLSDELDDSSPPQPADFSFQSASAEANTSHRGGRISKATHSAILWVLEEALRQPHPFSPDVDEENESMADLIGGGPVTTNGNRASAARRPTAPPTQTGSPSRGGVQGPVEIMRKRQERERQKKEKEAMELVEVRRREEQEALARLQQEEMRQGEAGRGAQHQQQAAGAGGGGRGGVGMGPGGASDDPQLDAMTQKRQQRAQEQGRTPASRIPSGSQQQQAQPLRASRVPTGGQLTRCTVAVRERHLCPMFNLAKPQTPRPRR